MTPGGTSQSFGLAVAELAGIPNPVIQRAQELLRDIQRDTEHLGKSSPTDATKSANTIFHNKSDLQQQAWSKIVKNVENININQLTPVQSLQTLEQLQVLLIP